MNKDLHTQSSNGKASELDLIELAQLLWSKKLWIGLFTIVFTLLAGIYAFTAKERWTSTAEIIRPKLVDLGNYYEIRQEYARITNTELDYLSLINGFFLNFNQLAYSLDEREEFFKNSAFYKKEIENVDEKKQRSILADMINKDLVITKPDPKKEDDMIGYKMSFSATTAQEARNTLEQFIQFIDNKTYQAEKQNFTIGFQEKIKDLEYEKAMLERDLSIAKTVQLENLDKAYNIAEKAGIKEYSKTLGNNDINQALAISDAKIPLSDSKLSDGSYLFMLGEKYLKAQIDVVNKDKVIFPPRYYQIQEQLKELVPLFNKLETAQTSTFRYLSSPDYPVSKDQPKRALILLLGLVLGFLLSSSFVLAKHIIVNKKS